MIKIIAYDDQYEEQLFRLIKDEGKDWADYWSIDKKPLYLENIKNSITFILVNHDYVIGYIRAIEDLHYCIYICDLLVDQKYRSNGYGKMLIAYIKKQYEHLEVYVMSDVDLYYDKLKYKKIGSIFKI